MPNLFLLVFVSMATLFAGPIRHDVSDEAYRGDPADYPAVFGLYAGPAGGLDCLATLIDAVWAVTAAHCTKDAPLLDGLASGDGYPVEIAGHEVRVVSYVRHPQTAEGADVDLALLRLDGPVPGVAIERIYPFDDELGRTVILPGWGDSGDGVDGIAEPDGVFRVSENRVDAVADGWLVWRFDDPRSRADQALALEGISGPGDSGGPAYVVTPKGRFVVGVSAGQRTFGGEEGLYGVDEYYVRLTWYAEWIAATIAGAN